jgi:hypothetical protein
VLNDEQWGTSKKTGKMAGMRESILRLVIHKKNKKNRNSKDDEDPQDADRDSSEESRDEDKKVCNFIDRTLQHVEKRQSALDGEEDFLITDMSARKPGHKGTEKEIQW